MEKIDHLDSISTPKDEIDLLDLIGHIWEKRKFIYKYLAIFFVIGIFIALVIIPEYKSEIELLPEITDKEGGVSGLMKQFGGLGSLAGIDLSNINSSDALNPKLYPDIIQSTPFMLELMNTNVKIPSADTSVTLFTYMTDIKKTSLFGYLSKYTIGLPLIVAEWFKNEEDENEISIDSSPIRISLDMSKTIEKLNDCIVTDVNMESGIISISAEFQDPELAAQVAEKTVSYLTDYITDYRLQKVKDNLKFITERCDTAKIEFFNAQMERAQFLDENKNIISARVQSEKDRLQSQYDLTFNVYNNLLQQREQAKIKVQEETPIFKVLSPVQVPVEKDKPRRSLIVIFMTFLGGIVSVLIIFFKKYLANSDKDLINKAI
jgi:uncharacterized protein involved in exopolysaccharide biosynthesis